MIRRVRWAALLAVAWGLALPAAAEDVAVLADAPEPSALLERAFRNLYGDDFVQVLRMETRSRGGREMTRRIQITRKQSESPGRALVRFLSPPSVRRTSILVLENTDASDDHYVYLPALRRTKHLSAAQRGDSFFGTDLAYEDIEPKYAKDYRVEQVGTDAVGGRACALLEIRARPGFESSYEKMVSCIELERAVIQWTDFYDRGRVVKRLEIDPDRVESVGPRFIPFAMTISTLRRDSETRVITESYELRPDIPDTLFSTWNLEVGDAERDRSRSAGRARAGSPDVGAGPPRP